MTGPVGSFLVSLFVAMGTSFWLIALEKFLRAFEADRDIHHDRAWQRHIN
jgi:hypothetical protein